MRYEVVVGNIGTVYEGRSKREAERTFRDYVLQSRGGYGRAGNEQVVLFEDGEVLREHEGTAEPEENPRRSGLFVPAGRYRRPTARERRLAEARLEIAGPALQEMPSDVRKDVERLVRRGEIEACPVCGGLSAHAYQDTDEATGLNLGIAKVGGTSLSAFQCGHCRRHIAEADSPYAYPMGHGPEEEDEDED